MAQYDLIIVGAGPAGMTAAIYGARADLSVLMLDRLAPGGNIINTNEIQNYPGVGFINGAELAIQMFEQTQQLGITFDYRTVVDIREENGEKAVVCLEDDMVYTGRTVIIATGTQSNKLHCEGEENYTGNGISWCAICDGAAYRDKDVVVIGVSKDSQTSHQKFAEKYNLPFILVSDPELTAIKAYDVWQEKKLYGKVSFGVVRSTYIIDPEGVIEKVYPKAKPDTNAAEILEYLESKNQES